MQQGFPEMRSPFFDKNVRKTDFVHMSCVDKKDAAPQSLPKVVAGGQAAKSR